MKEVSGYQANDGTFFEDKEKCLKYEARGQALIKLENLISAQWNHALSTELLRFFQENKDQLKEIINNL